MKTDRYAYTLYRAGGSQGDGEGLQVPGQGEKPARLLQYEVREGREASEDGGPF